MEELINLVLDNPFFIIIIIGAIYSLLKGKSKQEEQPEEQERQQGQQRQQRTPEIPKPITAKQSNYNRPTDRQRQEAISSISIEEHRAQQMKQFATSVSTNEHSMMTNRPKVADARRNAEIQNLSSSYNQVKFKKQFKKSLTNEGLINSVVMAEVLGLPRARNPYQSVIAKRAKS